MAAIPTQFEQLSVDWFNEVLNVEGTVTDVSWERIAVGVGLLGRLARVQLTWAAAGGGPDSVIVKLPTEIPEMLAQAEMFGFYDREINFYRHVGDDASVRVPHPFHVDAADGNVPFVIVMEDLADARVVDQLEGCTAAEACAVARAAARLHAPYWGKPELHDLAWLPAVDGPLYSAAGPLLIDMVPAFVDKYASILGPGDAEMAQAVANDLNALQKRAAAGPLTMCHYDLRLDNLLFEGDDVAMIDFQLMGTHRGPFDIAYFLGWSLTPEQRRACTDDVLAAYVAELDAQGIEVERSWVDDVYAESMLGVVSMAVLSGAMTEVENERGQQLIDALVSRAFTAAKDVDASSWLPT